MPRGRPASVPTETLISTVVAHSDQIFVNGAVVPKNQPIWKMISAKVENKIKPASIYSLVMNNRYNMLSKIKEQLNIIVNPEIVDDSAAEINSSCDNSKTELSYNEKEFTFEVLISSQTFEEMTEQVQYAQNTRENSKYKRKYNKFKKASGNHISTKKFGKTRS